MTFELKMSIVGSVVGSVTVQPAPLAGIVAVLWLMALTHPFRRRYRHPAAKHG